MLVAVAVAEDVELLVDVAVADAELDELDDDDALAVLVADGVA